MTDYTRSGDVSNNRPIVDTSDDESLDTTRAVCVEWDEDFPEDAGGYDPDSVIDAEWGV